MKKQLIAIAALAGLTLTIIPAFLTFLGKISFEEHKTLMLIGTAMWFVTAPFWLSHRREDTATS